MFTGIIEGTAPCLAVEAVGSGLAIWIGAPSLGSGAEPWRLVPGQSIAVCGTCLTVAGLAGDGERACFELSAETLARTWFGELRPGTLLNVERALRLGDRLDGHMVSGHVDGRARLEAVRDSGDGGSELTFSLPAELQRYAVDKGSICLDGVSLTVIAPRAGRFSVALIPTTLARTTLAAKRPGDPLNVEVDLVAKWIERLLPPRV